MTTESSVPAFLLACTAASIPSLLASVTLCSRLPSFSMSRPVPKVFVMIISAPASMYS